MKTVFITGGSRGIGKAIALKLAQEGYDIALNYANNDAAAEAAKEEIAATGVRCVSDVDKALEEAENVLIAVKPQYLVAALENFKGKFSGKLVISIVAGVTLETLSQLTGTSRLVRVMPNTPVLVGKGAAAFAGSSEAAKEDMELVSRIFNAAGIGLEVPEKLLDAVTGLSGSGPAYVFEFIQALADGGVAEGLPRDKAQMLAAQTVLGAAAMVLESGRHPAVLKDEVTSPGGTTARGLEKLAEKAFSGTVLQAVRAASARSAELGKK